MVAATRRTAHGSPHGRRAPPWPSEQDRENLQVSFSDANRVTGIKRGVSKSQSMDAWGKILGWFSCMIVALGAAGKLLGQ